MSRRLYSESSVSSLPIEPSPFCRREATSLRLLVTPLRSDTSLSSFDSAPRAPWPDSMRETTASMPAADFARSRDICSSFIMRPSGPRSDSSLPIAFCSRALTSTMRS